MIDLTKEKPSFNFTKQDQGDIRINLNWNQKQPKKKFLGLFGSGHKEIDLDLGAFIKLTDGSTHVVQALGNAFGSLPLAPYVRLEGDDRTGENVDGEWLIVNGNKLVNIEQILIYTYIYDGVANWTETDASVSIYVPGQEPIRTNITGDMKLTTCAIASIVNTDNGTVVTRLNSFHKSQSSMDAAYGWGFNWRAGRK